MIIGSMIRGTTVAGTHRRDLDLYLDDPPANPGWIALGIRVSVKNKPRAEIWVKPADLIALVGALPNGTDVTTLQGFNENDRPRVLDVRADPDAEWVQLAVRVPTNALPEGDIRVERADLGTAIGALLKQSSL